MLAIMAVINATSVICFNKAREPSSPPVILAACGIHWGGWVSFWTCVVTGLNRVCEQPARRRLHLSAVVPLVAILFVSLASPLHAQAPLLDPNLPTVKPKTLQHLSDNRVRQRIMQESQARYDGKCVCPYQTNDLNGRSCKGRHEVVTTQPQPICYPTQVTREMVSDWRRHH